jgi:hypothetical protein
MARDSNTLSAVLRAAWDGGPLRIMTRTDPRAADDAHISLIGHISAEELTRWLTETDYYSGLTNRILWVGARRSKLLPHGSGNECAAQLVKPLHDAIVFAREQKQAIERDSEARDLWEQVYGPLSEGKSGLFGAATSRAEAQVLRLSVLHAVANQSAVVTTEHLGAALAFWQYCEDSAWYLFGDRSGDNISDRIMIALRQVAPGWLTRTQTHGVFGRHVSAERLRLALEGLVERNAVEHRRTETAGRPVDEYRAVQELSESELCATSEEGCADSHNSHNSLPLQRPDRRSDASLVDHAITCPQCGDADGKLYGDGWWTCARCGSSQPGRPRAMSCDKPSELRPADQTRAPTSFGHVSTIVTMALGIRDGIDAERRAFGAKCRAGAACDHHRG